MLNEMALEWFGMKLLMRNICTHHQTFAQDNRAKTIILVFAGIILIFVRFSVLGSAPLGHTEPSERWPATLRVLQL